MKMKAMYENGIRQPMFTITAKNVNADREEEFLKIIFVIIIIYLKIIKSKKPTSSIVLK